MKEKCCRSCFYLSSKESKDFPLDDYHIKYSCELHKLYRGEVRWPNEQQCDDWISTKSGYRNQKIEELGIF